MASLKVTNTLPPKGWAYEQKNNSGVVVRSKWQNSMSPFGDFLKEVANFRTKNGYARPALIDVSTDVQDYMCAKNPDLCASQKKTVWVPSRSFRRSTPEIVQDVAAAVTAFGKLNSV